jgi:uncharacterized protein with PIN domain
VSWYKLNLVDFISQEDIFIMVTGPKCFACGCDINSVTMGYKKDDVSLSQMHLRFVEIFYCTKCGAILNIHRALKNDIIA